MRIQARLCFFLILICSGTFCPVQLAALDTQSYAAYRARAAQITAAMDDSTLAAQVILTAIEGRASLSPAMRTLLTQVPVGGIMLFRYNLDTPTEDVRRLISESSAFVTERAGIAPFIAVDHEGGLVHRFGPGVERLPSAFSFWELALREGWAVALNRAETLYRRSAEEIRGLGINMVLGPVAEPLYGDNHLFLGSRSYGPQPVFTRVAASTYIRSMDAFGISSVVKHFPGNTALDPHYHISILEQNRWALNEMTRPFAEIIRDLSPPALMLSHVIVPALDSERNASLSRAVIEDWLRGELGFEGIAMADDFAMRAVTDLGLSPAAAVVEALNAGIDMVMTWPHNLRATHSAILEALVSGRLPRERLLEAAQRIITEKIRYGLVP